MSDEHKYSVGDKVVIMHHSYAADRISEVIGITPKGFIRVKWGDRSSLLFNSDGRERGRAASWGRLRIKPAMQEDYDRLERDVLAYQLKDKTPWKELSLETLRQVKAILESSK